jgi:hypothetical protein
LLAVPRSPAWLELAVERRWDGAALQDPRLRGVVRLHTTPDGVVFEARLAHQTQPRLPAAPFGTRVADLWEYDVVECFLVGRGGAYLELELGAGGHFLALRFAAPRHRCDELADLRPVLAHRTDARGWTGRLVAPWSIVPEAVVALNAFVAAGGELLAHTPLPGPQADFHQPQRFAAARLEGDPR